MTANCPLRITIHPSLALSLPLAVLTLLFALTALPFAAFAQSATATLSGTVEDQNGAVVPGATVTSVNTATTLERKTTTNGSGDYTIPLLPAGTYVVRVEAQGFTPVRVDNVVLNVGDQKALQIQLKAGDVSATVQVVNEAPLINESPAVGTVVNRQFVENIPLNGRSFQTLIALTPGVVIARSSGATNSTGQFSVNGQRASANAFQVDGVSANFGAAPGSNPLAQSSGNLPGLTAFGTTQSLVSVDALQEFKIQTATYSAEYGRQPGGQISIATRSGTDDFHGSVFDYLRNDKLDANDWFANRAGQPRPPERQNDFGGTFSGPVFLPRFGEGGRQPGYNGRNRTFFFFSYEGLRLRLPSFTVTNVPTVNLRQQAAAALQPILNAFPLPNGRDLGNGLAEFSASYSNPSTLDATSVRIDHTINSKFSLFGRYNQAPSDVGTRVAGNLNLTRFARINTKTLTLGFIALLTPRLNNDFRANYSDNFAWSGVLQGNFAGAVPLLRNVLVPAQYDSENAQGVAVLQFPGRTASTPLVNFVDKNINSQRQFNFVDIVSYTAGPHHLKFGVDYRRLTPISAVNSYAPSANFANTQDVLNGRAGSFSIDATLPSRPIFVNLSLFGEDTWKITRRLTVNFGLRWEMNPSPDEANGNLPLAVTQIGNLSTMQLAPRGTRPWKTTYNNFAPRLGVAYQLRQDPNHVTILRGGFGVFYDTGNDLGALQFVVFPFRSRRVVQNLTFPIQPALVGPAPLPVSQAAITSPFGPTIVFDPHLKLPYTLNWSGAVEQALGLNQVFTVSYVGSSGSRLLQLRRLFLSSINPSFPDVSITSNAATSDYNSLQAQFQRRLSHGLQLLGSYTWSHAIDEDSQSSTERAAKRGNADFDIRHNFAAAVTYDIPTANSFGAARAILSNWAIDANVLARTALPVDVIARDMIDPSTGDAVIVRANLITGVPLYLQDATVPGGRKINRAAFSVPAAGQSGSLGRNIVRGLPTWQFDVALRRQFALTERLRLQFRAEAFNLFNHPNFGTIQTSLSAANFGEAINLLNRQLGGFSPLYQIGGPRSMQFALKLQY